MREIFILTNGGSPAQFEQPAMSADSVTLDHQGTRARSVTNSTDFSVNITLRCHVCVTVAIKENMLLLFFTFNNTKDIL